MPGLPSAYGRVATTYLPLFVYRNAFEYLRYGYASAATVVMFALTAAIVFVQWRIVRRWRAKNRDRLKELERENSELKKMLAESLLKNRVLEAVCEKKL